jgi:hypothetical protein
MDPADVTQVSGQSTTDTIWFGTEKKSEPPIGELQAIWQALTHESWPLVI